MRKLDNAIKENLGTQMGEWLSELRQMRKSVKSGTALKRIWLIDIQTFNGGKEYESGCGFSPCFFGTLKDCQSAIRVALTSIFKECEKQKYKPRIVTSFEDAKIAKGACRIYYTIKGKNCYRELKPTSFELADSLETAKKIMEI